MKHAQLSRGRRSTRPTKGGEQHLVLFCDKDKRSRLQRLLCRRGLHQEVCLHGPQAPFLVRFLPVSQYLLELASGVWVLECGVLTSRGA